MSYDNDTCEIMFELLQTKIKMIKEYERMLRKTIKTNDYTSFDDIINKYTKTKATLKNIFSVQENIISDLSKTPNYKGIVKKLQSGILKLQTEVEVSIKSIEEIQRTYQRRTKELNENLNSIVDNINSEDEMISVKIIDPSFELEDKKNQILKIENEVKEINSMTNIIKTLVNDQQPIVDSVELNLYKTNSVLPDTIIQLEKLKKSKRSSCGGCSIQ